MQAQIYWNIRLESLLSLKTPVAALCGNQEECYLHLI